MNVGVNDNGIEWYEITEGNFLCFFYAGDGVKMSHLFENVTRSFIDKVSVNDIIKN